MLLSHTHLAPSYQRTVFIRSDIFPLLQRPPPIFGVLLLWHLIWSPNFLLPRITSRNINSTRTSYNRGSTRRTIWSAVFTANSIAVHCRKMKTAKRHCTFFGTTFICFWRKYTTLWRSLAPTDSSDILDLVHECGDKKTKLGENFWNLQVCSRTTLGNTISADTIKFDISAPDPFQPQ